MDNPKANPNPNPNPAGPVPEEEQKGQLRGENGVDDAEEEREDGEVADAPRVLPSRTPFTNLSQVDADLALARTLQEQERAYMMLRLEGADGDLEEGSEFEFDYEEEDAQDVQDEEDHGSEEGSDYDDEDAFDAQEHSAEIDPSAYNDDEAYARALQDAEEREVAVRLMALTGINDWVADDREGHSSHSQDTWQDVDPDDFSYEELVALGEAVGTESRGLSEATIASLPSVIYKAENSQHENNDQCVICRLDYEEGDELSVLPCKHNYHTDCINKWLQINKVCPVCNAEVSTSGTR